MQIKNISIRSWSVMLSMALGCTLTACHDDNADTDVNGDNVEEYVADPTEDQKEVTYNGKTAVIDYDFDDMGLAIFSRLSNKTGELADDVDAVLLSPKALDSDFAIEEAVQLMRLYAKGTTIIMVEPKDKNWQKLGTLLKKAEELMEEDTTVNIDVHRLVDRWEMMQAQNSADNAFGNQDAVAMRVNDTYIISDLQEQADNCSRASGDTSQKVTDYCYGKSADLLMEWLDNAEENQAEMNASRAAAVSATRASSSGLVSLSSLAAAQMVTVQKTVGPSPIFEKTMPYEFKYTIYSLYNVDSDEEYYMIRQHVDYHCSRLGCTKNDNETWTYLKDEKKVRGEWVSKAFGPYMSGSTVTSKLVGLGGTETVHLLDPQPVTDNGTGQGYSSGFKLQLGGETFQGSRITATGANNSNLQPSSMLGVSWQVSYNVSTTGLTYIQNSKDNVETSWQMEGSKALMNPWHTKGHTSIAEFQFTDWNTDLTWYYRIEHPDKSRTYQLYVTDNTTLVELPNSSSSGEYGFALSSNNTHTVTLTPPDRYRQEWYMTCSDSELRSVISKQLSLWWNDNPVTTALTEKGLEEEMTYTFTRVKKSIKALGPILAMQGYNGNYTFRVRKRGASSDFMSFVLNNGVVE